MERTRGEGEGAPRKAGRPRYVFQVDRRDRGTVIRIIDSRTREVFREIPVEEFVEYARRSKDLRPLLFGRSA